MFNINFLTGSTGLNGYFFGFPDESQNKNNPEKSGKSCLKKRKWRSF
jgi:hypothetical protein